MGRPRVDIVPARHAYHGRNVWALAGPADLERALRSGVRSRCARLAARRHVAKPWILGTGRRLFVLRLAHHRHRVGSGREPSPLDPKSCYACGMVTPTFIRDFGGQPGRGAAPRMTQITSKDSNRKAAS